METAGERLGQESDYPDAAVLMGKEGMELAAKLTELKIKRNGTYLLGSIYYAMKRNTKNVKHMSVPLLAIAPEELSAAYFLLSI